jgi:hypothetical protein
MDDVQERFDDIRHRLDGLKAALATATDDAERHRLHEQINNCIRESIRLVDLRLGRGTSTSRAERADQGDSERRVGEKL